MVQTKKMNESVFAQLLKSLTVAGEIIGARQEEKQALLNQFDTECKRFFFGKISERALISSVKKTNKELLRLDKAIRANISISKKLSNKVSILVFAQSPIKYIAKVSGIESEKKKVVKKKTVNKKVVKKKTKRKKK